MACRRISYRLLNTEYVLVTFARLHVFCGHFLFQTCTSRSHVFQDSSLSHSKSLGGPLVSLTKRGRCSPEDGVVASSFPGPVTETHPSVTHDPAVGSQSHVECESKMEPNHAVDKKVKFEHTEMTQSTAYWQLSSG
jgi:hypothetical protein